MSRDRLSGRIRDNLPEILLLAVTTAAGLWAGGRWLDPMSDPGLWWSLSERLMSGEQLYRDVRLQYGPLSPYLLAGAGRVFGLSALSFLLLNWIPAVLLGVLLLRVARPYLGTLERVAVAGLLVGVGIFGPDRARLVLSYSPAAVHALCFSVASLLLLRRGRSSRWDPFAAGALCGLAFCAKQEVGVAAVAGTAALLAIRARSLRGWLLPFLSGVVPVVAAATFFAFRMASYDSLRYENHLWPIGTVPEAWKFLANLAMGLTADAPRRVGVAAVGLTCVFLVMGLISLLAVKDAPIRPSRSVAWGLLIALLVGCAAGFSVLREGWDPLCLSMLSAFAVALAALRSRSPGDEFLVGFGLFAGIVAMRTAFAGKVLWSSYSGIGSVATAVTWGLLLFRYGPELFPRGAAGLLARRIMAVAVLFYGAYLAFVGIRGLSEPGHVAVHTRRGAVWVHPALAPLLELLGRELRPGERVLVLPEANGLEPLFGIRAASAFPVTLPGWLDARAEQQILSQAQRQPPDAVVIFRRQTSELGVAPLGIGYGLNLLQWISGNYHVTGANPNGILFRPGPPNRTAQP